MLKNYLLTLSRTRLMCCIKLLLLFTGFTFYSLSAMAQQPCSPVSTLSCSVLKVSLPYKLDFSTPIPSTVTDKNSLGTGFTTINTYSGTRNAADGQPSNPQIPGYEPSKVALTDGRLRLTTSKGIDFQISNNLLNVWGARINAIPKLQLEIKLINPYYGTQSQQAGLWYGLSDKTFIKLCVTGNKVELRREKNDVSSTITGTANPDQRITPFIDGLNTQTVTIRLIIDSVNGIAEGFYSTDGTTFISTGAGYPTPGLNIADMGVTSGEVYTGVFATHRNGPSPVTYTFDDFSAISLAVPPPVQNSGAYMVLKNLDLFPSDDQLVTSLLQTPWRRTSPDTTPYNANHDKARLRISNQGASQLTLSALGLSNPAAWKIVSINTDPTASLPVNINPGAFVDVTVQFIAKDAATKIKLFNDTLSIASNDNDYPVKKVMLRGIWQRLGESTNEPYAQHILSVFGYGSKTGYGNNDGNIDGKTIVPNSNEVNASYFVQADPSKPIRVFQLAAYHSCCSATESFRWHSKGSASFKTVFTHNPLDGQSVIPRLMGSNTAPAAGMFNVTGPFGVRLGSSLSDRTLNAGGLIGIRVVKVLDGQGNIVPNAYFMNGDYVGTTFTNYDYQDNIYYVENIRPETGSPNYSELAVLPVTAINFAPANTGSTTSFNLSLKNMGTTYPDGTADPSIQIKSRQIVGPNASEFQLGTLSTTSIGRQATATLNVQFKPTSIGIKNAALIIYHNNSSAPVRIPLYGVANSTDSTVIVVKRIKGGSDVNVTIGNNLYEKDNLYRKGSIKLDKLATFKPIAGTDIDSLYQSYLSAAADKAETRYEIPVANGNYLIRMHFVETYWTVSGSRVFGVNVENKSVISNLDIFKEVGYGAAIVKDVKASVSDGILNIKFNPTANRVAIVAVELFSVNSASQLATASLFTPEQSGVRSISVFPNPGFGRDFNLNATNFNSNDKLFLTVSNMSGRVLQSHIFNTDEQGKASIYLQMKSLLSTGVYLINVRSRSGGAYSKLLVK